MAHTDDGTEVLDTPPSGEAAGLGAAPLPAGSRKKAFLAAAVVAMLVVAGVVGWRVLDARALTAAKQDYVAAVEAETSAHEALNTLVSEGETLVLDCPTRAADVSVCDELANTLNDVKELKTVESLDADKASKGQLNEATSEVEANTAKLNEAKTRLDDAVGKVKASVEAKALAEAKASFDQALSAAESQAAALQELIASTEGKVADEAIRQNAQTTLDELNALIAEAKTAGDDASKLADYASKLSEKTTAANQAQAAVNESHTAWANAQNTANQANNGRATNSTTTNSNRTVTQGSRTTSKANTGSSGGSTGSSANTGSSTGKTGGNSSGGWVETENSGGNFCGDEFGRTWTC